MLPQVRYPGASFLSGPSNAGLRLPARLRADLSLDPGQLPPGSALGPGSRVYYVLEDGAGVTAANATTTQRSATSRPLLAGSVLTVLQDIVYLAPVQGNYTLRVWWFSASSAPASGHDLLAISQPFKLMVRTQMLVSVSVNRLPCPATPLRVSYSVSPGCGIPTSLATHDA